MSYIPAWDAFSGYGRPDFERVAASGIRAMWHQACRGNEPEKDDPAFAANVAAARAAGIAVGAYLFPYPLPPGKDVNGLEIAGRTPQEQAERFARVSSLLGCVRGELSPMIDAEWPPPNEWARWGCSAQQLSDWLRTCCEEIARRFGRLPVIYTYPWWWSELARGADVSWARRYPLWIAHYLHPGPGLPPPSVQPARVAPWDGDWSIWQYSAEGSSERVPGCVACPVDRDVIRDEETLRRLMGLPRYDQDEDTKPVEIPTMRADPLKAKGYANLDYDPDAA